MEAMEALEAMELENPKSSALQPCGLPRSWHMACIWGTEKPIYNDTG